jgi:predicted PhzF superfamily epimerase YddE/YHI9
MRGRARRHVASVGPLDEPVGDDVPAAAHGTGTAAGGYRVSQGRRLGRGGDITITAEPDGTVWVGGCTNTPFQGAALI